jgi:molecular chaperone DnaJ
MRGMSGSREERRNLPRKGRDLKYVIEAPLYKFILGGDEELVVQYDDVCIDCNGKGFLSFTKCSECNGVGRILKVHEANGMHVRSASTCPKCRGFGEIGEEHCETCNSTGKIKVEKTYMIHIDKNTRDGQVAVHEGLGGSGINGGPNGDMYIKFKMIMPKEKNLTEEQKELLQTI